MTTHVLIGSANDLSPAHHIIGLTKIPFRGGGAFWKVGGGGLIFHSAISIPLLKFSKMRFALFIGTSHIHSV